MRCPKCGYISFDYNQVCSKCNKNIADEQAKLNLPAFRPDPPSLLGVLVGEANESNVGIHVDSSAVMDVHEMEGDLDDSLSFDEDQDLEISLEAGDSGEFELPDEMADTTSDVELEGEGSEISFDMDLLDTGESEDQLDLGSEEEGISMDLGDVPLNIPEEEDTESSGISLEEGEPELDLGDIALDDSISLEDDSGMTAEEVDVSSVDLDSAGFEPVEEPTGEEMDQSAIELNLDDLKINETGELEIGKHIEQMKKFEEAQVPADTLTDESFSDEEEALDLGDLSIDEIPAEDEDSEATMMVEDLVLDEAPAEEAEEELDLGDLSMGESYLGDEEKTLNDGIPSLEELSVEDDTGEDTSEEMLTEEFDLDSISLDDTGPDDEPKIESADDELTLDLDDLELDLDLDEKEDK